MRLATTVSAFLLFGNVWGMFSCGNNKINLINKTMVNKTEEWLYEKAKEVDSELELQDLYTSKFSFGGRWVMDLLEEYHNEQLSIPVVIVPKGTLCDRCGAEKEEPKDEMCVNCWQIYKNAY